MAEPPHQSTLLVQVAGQDGTAVVNALVGLGEPSTSVAALATGPHASSSVLWWLLAAVNAAFTLALLWGLGRTGQERPLPQAD